MMSFSRGRQGRKGGRWRSEGRSAHSSLGCNWISTACTGRMFSPHSPCRGGLARFSSNLPDSFKVSLANRLLALQNSLPTTCHLHVWIYRCICMKVSCMVWYSGSCRVYDRPRGLWHLYQMENFEVSSPLWSRRWIITAVWHKWWN